MSAIKLSTPSSGSISLSPADTASNLTITVPAVTGTMNLVGPAFSAFLSSDQTVTDAVTTKINFDAEDFDTASCFSSGRFTPNVAGYYYVSTSLTHRQTNITDAVLIIYKNGSSYKRASEWFDSSSSQDNLAMSGECLVYLNGTTDYVEVYLYSDGTGNATEIGGSPNTYFQGFFVRA